MNADVLSKNDYSPAKSFNSSCDLKSELQHLWKWCAGKKATAEVSWSFMWFILLGLAVAGFGGYAVYKYRIRVILSVPSLSLCSSPTAAEAHATFLKDFFFKTKPP